MAHLREFTKKAQQPWPNHIGNLTNGENYIKKNRDRLSTTSCYLSWASHVRVSLSSILRGCYDQWCGAGRSRFEGPAPTKMKKKNLFSFFYSSGREAEVWWPAAGCRRSESGVCAPLISCDHAQADQHQVQASAGRQEGGGGSYIDKLTLLKTNSQAQIGNVIE